MNKLVNGEELLNTLLRTLVKGQDEGYYIEPSLFDELVDIIIKLGADYKLEKQTIIKDIERKLGLCAICFERYHLNEAGICDDCQIEYIDN